MVWFLHTLARNATEKPGFTIESLGCAAVLSIEKLHRMEQYTAMPKVDLSIEYFLRNLDFHRTAIPHPSASLLAPQDRQTTCARKDLTSVAAEQRYQALVEGET